MPKLSQKSFNYAIGMFGTSIPINMLKTYAAIFYVDSLMVISFTSSFLIDFEKAPAASAVAKVG